MKFALAARQYQQLWEHPCSFLEWIDHLKKSVASGAFRRVAKGLKQR
jgi:hypothetical protein